MGYRNDDWYDWGHGTMWMGIAGLIFWVFIIGLTVFLLTRVARNSQHAALDKKESPREILDRRLANGEVSKDDYIVARELLEEKKK